MNDDQMITALARAAALADGTDADDLDATSLHPAYQGIARQFLAMHEMLSRIKDGHAIEDAVDDANEGAD